MPSIYRGKDVAVTLTKTTSGDKGAYYAQSISFSAKQDIEAIDTLGYDYTQAWSKGLKTFEGDLVEAFETGITNTQINRASPFLTNNDEYVMTLAWNNGTNSRSLTVSGVVFHDISIPSVKNKPVVLTSKWKGTVAFLTSTP
jgi:hypothetical protein